MLVAAVCGALTLALVVLLGVHCMAPATNAPTEPTSTSTASYSVETADEDSSGQKNVLADTGIRESSLPSGADGYTDTEDSPSPISESGGFSRAQQPVQDLGIRQPPAEEGGANIGLRVVVDVVLVLAVAALGFLIWWKQGTLKKSLIWWKQGTLKKSNESTLESINRTLEESRVQYWTLSENVKLLHSDVKLLHSDVKSLHIVVLEKLDQLKTKTSVDPATVPDAREGFAARQTSTDGSFDDPGEAHAGLQRGPNGLSEAARAPSQTEVLCRVLQNAADDALSQQLYESSASFTQAVLAKLQDREKNWAQKKCLLLAAHNSANNFREAYYRPDFISVISADGNISWLLPRRDAKYTYSHDNYYEGGEACWPNVKVPAQCKIDPSGGVDLIKMGTLG